MANTPNLGLPLLSPSQAQKHVTVNEALTLVDLAANLSFAVESNTTPPASPLDGDAHLVPDLAEDAWFGQDGRIALFSNGGWVFVTPKAGWKGWNRTLGQFVTFDGVAWVAATDKSAAKHGWRFHDQLKDCHHAH